MLETPKRQSESNRSARLIKIDPATSPKAGIPALAFTGRMPPREPIIYSAHEVGSTASTAVRTGSAGYSQSRASGEGMHDRLKGASFGSLVDLKVQELRPLGSEHGTHPVDRVTESLQVEN
jgi:hypothetical protein